MRSARREAVVSLALGGLALTYTIGYAALFGYGRSLDSLTFVFGVPDWVFWGIIVPWLACLAASWWFSFWFVEDDALEHAAAAPIDGPALFEDDSAASHDAPAPHNPREAP